MRKKENPENVSARVKKYRDAPDHKKVEIVGLTAKEKEDFLNLKGLESLSYANKIRILMAVWNKQSEEFLDDILEFQYKELDIANSEFLMVHQIYDKVLISFIENNNISAKTLGHKLGYLKEFGVTISLQTPYLLYLKNICEENKFKHVARTFIEMILNKDFIENFLQKIESEKRKHEEEIKLKEEYVKQEIDKVCRYLIGKKELTYI